MLALEELQGLDTTQIGQQRHQNAQNAYRQGCILFEAAITHDYDKSLIERAAKSFIQGIRIKRTEPLNYLGLAYIFCLLEQYSESLTILQQLLRLSPDNAEAQSLWERAQRGKTQPLSMPTEPTLEAELDYDALYERLRYQMIDWVRQASSQALPQTPSLDPQEMVRLQEATQYYQRLLSEITQQMSLLEYEIDLGELRRLLQPLETQARQVQRLQENTLAFVALQAEMQQEIQACQNWQHALSQQGLTTAREENDPARLEQLLDHCDALADQLDSFENKDLNIAALEQIYNRLIHQVSAIQELLDEL